MSDTTGFDVNEKVNVLFKTAMGFPSTKESTNWFQETNVPYNTYVFGSDILTDDIPTNPTYGAAKTSASVGLTDNDFDTGGFVKDSNDGKVRYYHRLILDQCITNNSDSWHKENSSGDNVLMDALQFNVNKTASNTPYGYVLTNKANVAADNAAPNEILQNAAGGNWFFDIKSGIVFFPDNSTPSLGVVDNSTKKPVFSFYKYIGNKGLSTWSGGGGGGGGATTLNALTDVTSSGATDGQALVWDNATSKWKPGSVAAASSGSGSSSGLIHFQGSSNTKYSAASNGFNKIINNYWSDPKGTPFTASNVDVFKTYASSGAAHDSYMSFQFKNEGAAMDNNTGIFLCPQDGVYICSASWSQNIASNATGHVILMWQLPEFVTTYDAEHWCHDRFYLEDGETCADGVSKNIWFPENTKLAFGILTTRPYDILRVSISLMGTGAGGTTTGSSDAVKDGQVLETLEGLCDGRTVIGASGTYILPNVTATQDLTETYTDLTGSLINYKPPSGTKIVVYSLKVQANVGGGSYWNCGYQLYIDDVAFGVINLQGTAAYVSQEEIIEIRIYITGTDDYANYNIASWETLKTIKLKCRERNSSRQSKMHHADGYVTEVGGPGGLRKPTMKITAIGRGKSGVALVGTNLVHKRITNTAMYQNIMGPVVPADTVANATAITELEITIKPEYSDSTIHVEWNIWFEANENNVFRIVRFVNGVSTVFSNDDTTGESGYAVSKYDVNTESTPNQIIMDLYDEPNTTEEVTYKVYISYVYTSAAVQKFVLNRVYLDSLHAANAPTSTGEKAVSTVKATEHPKPNKALNPITSATQVDGQVLETLAGVCDGRSVTVASGTYTLEDVTAIQNPGTTEENVTGSTIHYKPPVGSKQVIYTFEFAFSTVDNRSIMDFNFFIDGTKVVISKNSLEKANYDEFKYKYKVILSIGEADDIANGKILTWDTSKKLEVKADNHTTSHEGRLHYVWHSQSSGDDYIAKPSIEITAIGTADYDVVQRVVTYKDGQVLENLVGNCDGRTVTVASGTYTIQDARGSSAYAGRQWDGQTTTLTWTTIRGSEISYKPPPGTNKVLFKFNFHVRYMDEDCIIYTRLIIDDSDRIFFKEISTREYPSLEVQLAYVIDIGEVDEINDHSAKFLNWDTPKTLKLEVRSHSSSYDAYLFASQWDEENSGEDVFQFPILEIQAIGRQVAPASAADFKIQKVDTISTLPNNGNMLTWDQAKGRWKPSEFIVANDDGTKNISDTDRYSGYTASSSSSYNEATNNGYVADNAFFHPEKTDSSAGMWLSENNTYSSGSYNGSVSTNGYNGEWVQLDFGKKVKVYSYGIRGQTAGSNLFYRSPGGYKLFGSNDGSTWTEVHVGSASLSDYDVIYQKMNHNTLSTPVTYQYFRLAINSLVGSTNVVGIFYLAFYGNFPNERIQTLPVSGVNLSYVNFKDAEGVTIGNTSHTEIQGLRLSFTPEYNDSVVELNYVVQLELAGDFNATRDIGAVLTRTVNGVETIFRSNGGTDRWDTLQATSGYDGYSHHMHMMSIKYYDEPNTTLPITYKIKLIQTGAGTNQLVYINRSATSTGGSSAETAISVASAKELPKPQAIMSSVNNSTAVEGQVLETLSGMCDGHSVSVSSGNYTLQDVTSTILVTGSNNTAGQPNDPWIDLTGSTINYTPPVGTKQVIYEFDYAHSSSDTNLTAALHLHQVLLDGVKIEQSFRSHRTGGNNMYEVAHERVMCIIDIGEEDDITNNKIKNWTTSKEIKIQVASYSSNYKALMHSVQHGRSQYYGEASGTHDDAVGHLRKPNIKITAIGTAQYDVVQRVVNYKDGQILETLAGVCDGRSVTVASGTYTLENVTTGQVNSTTDAIFRKLNGSEISYKPPVGTKQVSFKFYFHVKLNSDGNSSYQFNIKFLIDGNIYSASHDVMNMRGSYSEGWHEYTVILSIGDVGTDDIANGKLASWDTLKTLKLEYCDNGDARKNVFHETTTWVYDNANWTYDNVFVVPRIEIQAIGRAVEPASAADFKIQRVNTLSSEPDNGSVLLYDSGKKEWTASGTRMEDQDIRLLSNPNIYPNYEMLASSTYYSTDSTPEWYQVEAAFHLNHNYPHSMWSSPDKYASSGTPRSYSGSETTEGYSGEWVQINLKKKAKIYYYGVAINKQTGLPRNPYDWRIYGSNNGTTWTQIDEQQGRTWDSWWTNWDQRPFTSNNKINTAIPQKMQYVELSQPETYQYFRMVINKTEGDTKVQVCFLGFYGVWDTISATTSVQAGTNMSFVNFTDTPSITLAANTLTELTDFQMSIKPQYNDSVIRLEYNIHGSVGGASWDGVYTVTRTVGSVETALTKDPTNNQYYSGYLIAGDLSNTMHSKAVFQYCDEPNTTELVTYKIKFRDSGTETRTLHINKTNGSVPAGTSKENAVSSASAIEHPKQQAILSTVSNSTALEGQVLETLTGICDGRSIVVASGTYTLENVTAKQVLASTTYVKANGSAISYKPPSGARQVIISYATSIQARQATWDPIITAIAKIGNSLTTNHFQTWRPHGTGDYGELYYNFTFIIDIGSVASDDIANGKLASWDVLKDIEINMKSYDTAGYSAIIHSTMHDGSNYVSAGLFTPPRLTITAIGTTYHSAVPRIVTKKSGQLLETITGVCDGRSITSASGTYTLENITQGTELDSSTSNFIDFPGSSINYKPPSGTKQVFYTFHFASGRSDNHSSLGFKFFIDGAEATVAKKYYGTNGDYGSSLHGIHFVIDIGNVSTDDIANGKLATWNTLKTIKLQVCGQNASYETWINKNGYDLQQGNSDSVFSSDASTFVVKPILKIQAFGEAGTAAGGVITETSGKVGIGMDSPEAPLHIGKNFNNNNIRITQFGSSSYPNHQTNIMHGGQHYDVYESATPQVPGSNSNGLYMYLNYYSGSGVRIAGGTNVTSDDRIKHNEKIIENALDIINKITAKKYFKSQKRYDENHNYELDNSGVPITEDYYKIETGFIAQEVMAVPELKYLVGEVEDKKGGNGDITVRGRYVLRYNDLFCYNIAATQELDKKAIALETKNTELETKNTELETKNTELENRVKELENKVNDAEMKVNTVYHKNGLLEAEIMMIKNKLGM